MLKAGSGNTIFLGLSELNVEKLKEGKPIAFDGGVIGFPGKRFVIFYGVDEANLAQQLADAAKPTGQRH